MTVQQTLNNLTGNFNTQSFDIDHEGVTTNVVSRYNPIPGAENVLSNEVSSEVTAPVVDNGLKL